MELDIADLLTDLHDTATIEDLLVALDALVHYSEWVLEQEREAGDARPWQHRQAEILTASRRLATLALASELEVLLGILVPRSSTSG